MGYISQIIRLEPGNMSENKYIRGNLSDPKDLHQNVGISDLSAQID